MIARSSEFMCVAKGLLASPPSGGISVEQNIFQIVFTDQWAELQKELSGSGSKKDDAGGEAPADKPKTDPLSEKATEETQLTKDAVKEKADQRAEEILNMNLFISSPEMWETITLKTSIEAGKFSGRAVGFFNPRCDDEARVTAGHNYFKRHPPVNKGRLESFTEDLLI